MPTVKCGCRDCDGRCPNTMDVPPYAVGSYARCDHCSRPDHEIIAIIVSPVQKADETKVRDDG